MLTAIPTSSTIATSMPLFDTDEQLMLHYRNGNASAFDMLYERHKGGIFRYLLRQCGQRDMAEELAQDIWLKLIHARERYQHQARFTTYLYRIAHNRLIDFYRQHHKQLADAFAESDETNIEEIAALSSYQPEEQLHASHQQQVILQAIASLPAPQREAFLLREENQLSLEEIACVTGVGIETAKSRLRYAVNSLRKLLRGAV